MTHITSRPTKRRVDTAAAAAICEALGITANLCSSITITITAPGTFIVEHTSWINDPDTPTIADQFKQMGWTDLKDEA